MKGDIDGRQKVDAFQTLSESRFCKGAQKTPERSCFFLVRCYKKKYPLGGVKQ